MNIGFRQIKAKNKRYLLIIFLIINLFFIYHFKILNHANEIYKKTIEEQKKLIENKNKPVEG